MSSPDPRLSQFLKQILSAVQSGFVVRYRKRGSGQSRKCCVEVRPHARMFPVCVCDRCSMEWTWIYVVVSRRARARDARVLFYNVTQRGGSDVSVTHNNVREHQGSLCWRRTSDPRGTNPRSPPAPLLNLRKSQLLGETEFSKIACTFVRETVRATQHPARGN